MKNKLTKAKRVVGVLVIVWLSVLSPAAAWADEVAVDAVGDPTGAPTDTGAPECTGAGCGQGAGQGTDQGVDQGGPSAEDLGADEEGNLPEGVEDTRQGAGQGEQQGEQQGSGTEIEGTNSNTGAGSDNKVGVDVDNASDTGINNTVDDTTNVGATANSGNNSQSSNTQADGMTTGNASIGVTQVKNDNTTVVGGVSGEASGLNAMGHNGDYNGDLLLEFNANTGYLTGDEGGSIRAINDTTGADSNNSVDIDTRTEDVMEVQNDGVINNILDLAAITGQNEANKNTSDGSIATGDANIAATLVNLLNTTVINGGLWLTVADIFGDLNGDIVLPDFGALAAAAGFSGVDIVADNSETGEGSGNSIDVNVTNEEITTVDNEADINTKVDAEVITGQNEALANTGGGDIATGDGTVTASNITLANTTVEGGNWGLVVINALDSWLGFLVGDSGEVRSLSQNETLRQIEAQNNNTGSGSDNSIVVNDETKIVTDVDNNAEINNDVTATAITGQNKANKNTGAGVIETGDANVEVTAVNIANTTVKDGSLFIAVVNIFGDWMGDLVYGGSSLLASAGQGAGQGVVNVEAENTETGADSDNSIDVEVNHRDTTEINNEADLDTVLNANIDTGGNRSNRNTLGGTVDTGNGLLALHSRAIANVTGLVIDPMIGLSVEGLNDTTGFNSKNKIRARLNDERIISITNGADISTVFGVIANTGNNEANANTLGGGVTTGTVDAAIGIDNMVNKIVLAMAEGAGWEETGLAGVLGGDGSSVDAELANRLTGALSENENDVAAIYNLLADVTNRGVIENIIDLMLNTGGNQANDNTGGGYTMTGAGCVEGNLSNQVNDFDVAGLGGWSVNLGNEADINNDFNVRATTGGNEANRNTGGGESDDYDGGCNKIVQVPEPEEPGVPEELTQPTEIAGVGGAVVAEEGNNDQGPDNNNPQVAAAIDDKRGGGPKKGPVARGLLKRFPVAGDVSQSVWLAGENKSRMWLLFIMISMVLSGAAWHGDEMARRQVALERSLVK